jgi:hypothetical protein
MACNECDRCKALGYKFCIKCGESFQDTAAVPIHVIKRKEDKERNLTKLVIPAMIVFLIGLLFSIALDIVGFTGVWNYIYDQQRFGLYLFLPVYVRITILSGLSIQLFWVFIVAMVLICAAVMLYRSRTVFDLRGSDYLERAAETPIFGVAMVLSATLVIEMIINFILIGLGMEVSAPSELIDMPLDKALFEFTEAGVWEEIAFRLVPFGVPMMIAALVCRQKDFYRYLLGGFGISKLSIILLVISAIIFAYAHVSGWGAWKFIPTFLGGMMLGFIYMKFGLYASILAHFINDFMAVWISAAEIAGSLLMLSLLGCGLLCVLPLMMRFFDGLRNLKNYPTTGFAAPEEAQDDSMGPKTD